MADFNTQVVAEFRGNDGRVGGMFADLDLLLLRHTGAKSGAERVTPLAYFKDGDNYAIFASKGGAPTHPAWYHNLLANPETTIEVGTDTLEVTASEAQGAERDRIYNAHAERAPQFAEYEEKTGGRIIPVIVLSPREA